MNRAEIVMVCSQVPPVYGGAGAQALLLGENLVRRGWEVTLVSLDQLGRGDEVLRGVRVRRFLRGRAPVGGVSRFVTTVGLSVAGAGVILRRRPQIVHIHGIFWWSILPVVVGKLIGSRCVVKSTRDGEDDVSTVVSRRAHGVRVGWLYSLSIRLADIVVVLNRDSFRKAEVAGYGQKTVIMLNGVDTELYANGVRKSVPDGSRPGSVVFVGYLVEHKGIFDLLDAWKLVNRKEVRLRLVGPVDGFYRELTVGVREAVASLVEEGFAVELVGHVPSEAMPAIYRQCDIFTLPSYSEGSPNSMLEAIVGGCQVVVSDIPGINDLVGQENAWLVPPGAPTDLAKSLLQALGGERRNIELVARRLDIRQVAEHYEILYRSPKLAFTAGHVT